ncbi:MAG: aminodeoxychorismate lyase [Gammaproteobacteria bacterium]|nr:MAG: aminodeoxychorismate lyase [Gammaproteobacteria bacterium]
MNKTPVNSLINGIASDYLTINDRSIHYGDGLFETILCNNNKLYYWSQHYQRLQASAEQLKIACPPEQVLLDDIAKLLDKNKPGSKSGSKLEAACAIKVIVSRGAGERGYQFSKNTAASRFILLSALEADYSSLLSQQLLSGELFICKQQVSINENLAGLKHLNRLENVMARNEWNDKAKNNFIDGLMQNANHHVIEGTMSNLFAIKNKQLFTPDLKLSGVNGIMREIIIDLASKNNIKISIVNLTLDDLTAMDELFISNSLIGMKAVTKLGDSFYKDQTVTNMIFTELLNTREAHAQAV